MLNPVIRLCFCFVQDSFWSNVTFVNWNISKKKTTEMKGLLAVIRTVLVVNRTVIIEKKKHTTFYTLTAKKRTHLFPSISL